MLTRPALWLALAATTSARPTLAADAAPVTRVSLPTEGNDEAWRAPGFRLELAPLYDLGRGSRPAPTSSHGFGLLVRPSIRVDERWSVGLALQYASYSAPLLSGFRWATTLEPELHLGRGLVVALGAGIGGLALAASDPPGYHDPTVPTNPADDDVAINRDLPAGPRLSRCDALAFVGLARLEYTFTVSSLFATGPLAQGLAQWAVCSAENGEVDAETGRKIVARQPWRSLGLSLGWSLSWR